MFLDWEENQAFGAATSGLYMGLREQGLQRGLPLPCHAVDYQTWWHSYSSKLRKISGPGKCFISNYLINSIYLSK